MRKVLLCFFLLAVWTGSCTYEQADSPACGLPDTVSFSRDIQPIFAAHCTDISCHTGNMPAANFNLEPDRAYQELSDPGSGYLDTLQPHISLFYAQMISVSTPMPPSGNLDDCTTDLVLKWIEQKAKNN